MERLKLEMVAAYIDHETRLNYTMGTVCIIHRVTTIGTCCAKPPLLQSDSRLLLGTEQDRCADLGQLARWNLSIFRIRSRCSLKLLGRGAIG